MASKHFFKILTIFMAMIAIGLISLLILNNYNQKTVEKTSANNQIPVAK